MKNAIILAAGKSSKFAPFTYEKPKGLFNVRGEVLIERQINQLIEAGIKEIIIVVGYMKEKYFYLENLYKEVHLIANNTFEKFGNIYSVYLAKEYLHDTFLCCADHYFLKNPFLDNNDKNESYRYIASTSSNYGVRFNVSCSDSNVITECDVCGNTNYCMVGPAYFNDKFSKLFLSLLDNEIGDFGVSHMFWEEFYSKHIKELTLFAKDSFVYDILEFNSVNELREFDSDFLLNIDSEIILNICGKLNCKPNEIIDISVIQAGLTNVSFKFSVRNIDYVYRHPGASAGNLIDRTTELYVQTKAKELNLDKSFIYMDPTGWKLSYFVQDIVKCDFLNNPMQLNKAVEYLRTVHTIPKNDDVKIFDQYVEGLKLIKLASLTKGNLNAEFNELFTKIKKVNEFLALERQKYNIELVVSHNDVYEPNFIATSNNDLYLIDWEYAGIMDPANDICSIITRAEHTQEQIDYLINTYYGKKLNNQEYRHIMGQSIVNAFYWFSWSLYKGSVGEDDGFFFLPVYRYLNKYIDSVIESYKVI